MKNKSAKNSVLAKVLAGILVGLLVVSAVALPILYILG
jgi:hypothetical protein